MWKSVLDQLVLLRVQCCTVLYISVNRCECLTVVCEHSPDVLKSDRLIDVDV